MGVRWSRYDPGESRPKDIVGDAAEDVSRAFEAHIARYVRLGWTLVDQDDKPLRARLVYRQRRRGWKPQPAKSVDTGERLVWVDSTGTIRTAGTPDA
jgi:hypothetical protein